MGNFQYKSSGSWVDVPDAAKPDDEGSIVVMYPEPQARDGTGLPCGVVGQPYISIRYVKMLGSGIDFWRAFFANGVAPYFSITGITAFDPRTGTWRKFMGTLLRPTFASVQPGASLVLTWYREGEIIVDNIAETT